MDVLRTAILDFCRRKRGGSLDPSEIVKQMFPEDWALFLEDLDAELQQMQDENLIELAQNGVPILPGQIPDGLIQISVVGQPK